MWPGSGYEGWFLVEGSVFEHAVDHVAAPTREADDGGVVVFALFAFALVIGHGGRVFGGCDERGLPQRVLEAFVAPPGGPFAFDAGAGLAGDGRYARVGGQMGGRFEVGDVAADAEQDVACGPDAIPGIDVRTVRRGWSSRSFSTWRPTSRRRSLIVLMSWAMEGMMVSAMRVPGRGDGAARRSP